MLDNFKYSCEHLAVLDRWNKDTDSSTAVVGTNVFQPGLGVTESGQGDDFQNPVTGFDLDVMRRLNAFNRFNGGPDDRYYYWNTISPSPELTGVAPPASLSAQSVILTGFTNTQILLALNNVAHNVAAATTARLCDEQYTQGESIATTVDVPSQLFDFPHDWDTNGNPITLTRNNFVTTGANKDDIYIRLGIYKATDGISAPSARARVVDSNTTHDGDGFMPPDDHWVKFGYVIDSGGGGTDGWRDYNTDGAKDGDGQCYGEGPSTGNASAPRSTRYADKCERRTSDH